MESTIITVCIVEDQEVIRRTVMDIVDTSDGIVCCGAFTNAEDFIKEYDTLQPDVTLMDIDLPGMPGDEAIFRIKSAHPNAKFLVLTVFNDSAKVFRALKAGAGGYLLKKYSYDQLADKIVELYHNGAPMSPEIARQVISSFQQKDEFNQLTTKEKLVLDMIVDGFLYKEIADKLDVTINAIKKHTHNIYEKLHVRSRSEVIKKYLKG